MLIKLSADGELELGESAGRFDYEDLREATDDFDVKNKIGEGGFGQVFKVRNNPHLFNW